MMMQRFILACASVLVCLVVLAGCKDTEKEQVLLETQKAKAELAKVKAELKATREERDVLNTTVGSLSKSLQDLKSQLAGVTKVRDELQEAAQQAMDFKEQIGKLVKERDLAVGKASYAQSVIEKLNNQLQENMQKAAGLEDQNKKLETIVQDLKKKLGGDITLPLLPNL